MAWPAPLSVRRDGRARASSRGGQPPRCRCVERGPAVVAAAVVAGRRRGDRVHPGRETPPHMIRSLRTSAHTSSGRPSTTTLDPVRRRRTELSPRRPGDRRSEFPRERAGRRRRSSCTFIHLSFAVDVGFEALVVPGTATPEGCGCAPRRGCRRLAEAAELRLTADDLTGGTSQSPTWVRGTS
jgi:hypothetical protein